MNKKVDDLKYVEFLIEGVLSRCATKRGMTEHSIEAVITLEQEIEMHKAMIENLLKGQMEAEYKGDPDVPMDIDKFVFRLTKQGKKSITQMIVEKK